MAGTRPAIPTKSKKTAVAFPHRVYSNRNIVQWLKARLKEWQAIATRYEKTAISFVGVLCLGATLDWIK